MNIYLGNSNASSNNGSTTVLTDWADTNFDKELDNFYSYKSYSSLRSIDTKQRLKHLYETNYLFL